MIDAFHTVAVAKRDEIESAARELPPGSPAARLLGAVSAQYDGDVEGAIHTLRSLAGDGGAEAPYAADVLAPILVMRSGHEREIASLVETLERSGWRASAAAFRAYLAIRAGSPSEAREHVARAAHLLAGEDDPIVRFRIEQRLARVSYYLHDYDAAMRLASASAAGAARLGAWRAAAAGYSILYNIHNDVTGDVAEADHYAGRTRIAATRSDDASFLHAALVAEFELAVQSADEPRISLLRDEIRRRLLPPQYAEHFPLVFSEALLKATTDLRAFASLLQVLRDAGDRSRGERALCTALIGVVHAAGFADTAARSDIRAAIQSLGRPRPTDPAFEQRYRRLARIAVAVTCVLVGDKVRAERVLGAAEIAGGHVERDLVPAAISGDTARAPRWYLAYARLFAGAFSARRAAEPPVQLTPAELEVLRLLAAGYGPRRIAHDSGRSINTVYNHTRSILEKFEARRTTEAVAIARRFGMLA